MSGRTKSVLSLAIQDSKGLSNTAHASLPIFSVLRLKCLFTVSSAGFRAGNYRDRLSWDLACSPWAFNPLSACPRFTSNNLVAPLIVTLWYDPEFTGRLGVKAGLWLADSQPSEMRERSPGFGAPRHHRSSLGNVPYRAEFPASSGHRPDARPPVLLC
jgi:hypothetical protein